MTARPHYERPCRCEPNPFQCGDGCTCVGCGCRRERPVIFTGGNVVEIREDRKTQTRRIMKVQPVLADDTWTFRGAGWPAGWRSVPVMPGHSLAAACPYGQPGDRLWVRETWAAGKGYDADPARKLRRAKVSDMHKGINVWYCADLSGPTCWSAFGVGTGGLVERLHTERNEPKGRGQWRPSIFMPRWASRVQLEVTRVRVERLKAISAADAIAEGVTQFLEWGNDPVGKYRELWQSIHGPGSWELNPWVWCIDFKQIEVTCG